MLRTVMAACLHKLSTGLCTAPLDAREHEGKTVRAIRYNGSDGPARAAAGNSPQWGR
jgi:hypothetical protein